MLRDVVNSITIHHGDILDSSNHKDIILEYDTVVHCAAIVSYAPHRFDEMYQINVEGTRYIVDECLAQNKSLIFISSIAALGTSKNEVIDETAKWDETEPTTFYSKTKYLSEIEVWRGIEEGLNAIIFNPSVVLGKGDLDKSSSKLFSYVKNGGKYYTEGKLNYVSADDVATLVVKSLDKPQTWGKRYIVNSENVTYKDFFISIANAYGVNAPNKKVSDTLAAIIWRYEKLKYWLTRKEPLITKETVQLSKRIKTFDNSLSIREFGIQYEKLEKIISKVCKKTQVQ